MNLSLYKLRKRLNKSGQGSLVGVVIGGIVLSTLVASATSWYITMRNNIGDTEEKLEAQTIAQSEWERLSHMSLDELEANRSNFAKPYSAGTGSQYQVSVNLGQKGTFNNGTCGNVSNGYANCFKNTTITVYRDNNRLYTTRTLPLMAGDYTRKEIDEKIASINGALNAQKNDYTNKYNSLANQYNSVANRLNGKEFVKNRTPNYDLNFRYEKLDGDSELTLHAYNGNSEIEFGGRNSYGSLDYNEVLLIAYEDYRNAGIPEQDVALKNTNATFTAPCDGVMYFLGGDPIPRGTYQGKRFDADLYPHDAGHIYVNKKVGFNSGNPWFFVLSKGDQIHWWANHWTYFIPYKGQGFTRAKYLNGTWR